MYENINYTIIRIWRYKITQVWKYTNVNVENINVKSVKRYVKKYIYKNYKYMEKYIEKYIFTYIIYIYTDKYI